jgi:hypothetical protein
VDAEIYHIAALRIMLHVYPSAVHPIIGLQYFLCAKLSWLLVHIEDAIKYWQRAQYILSITHGRDHVLVNSIEASLQEAAYELYMRENQNMEIGKLSLKNSSDIDSDESKQHDGKTDIAPNSANQSNNIIQRLSNLLLS